MALFGKNNSAGQAKKTGEMGFGSLNLVGPGTVIKGEVETAGDIRIDGIVRGSITSGSKVVIGDSAEIYGDIVCQNADVSGKIEGNVTVQELLTLKGSSTVHGDINTQKLVVEAGANFVGNCKMGEYDNQGASAPSGAKEPSKTGRDILEEVEG